MNDQGVPPSRRRSSQFPPTTVSGLSTDVLGDWRWSLSTATPSAAGPSKRPSAQTDGVEDSPPSENDNTEVPPEVLNRWPSFCRYYQMHFFDLVVLSVLSSLSFGLWYVQPVPNRWFSTADPAIAYPLRDPILNSWQAGLIAALPPLVVFLVMQCRLASVVDFHSASLGLGYSILLACTFQIIIKWLIGGLRPNFLAICNLEEVYYDNSLPVVYYRAKDVCRGNVKEAVESFPSGHATAAFAGYVFLSLYLNGKLKVIANRRPQPLSAMFVVIPLLGASLIAGALTVDKWHHWYDIVAGAIIGTLSAFMSYRMSYASIWDSRFNHIPLSKRYAFTYRLDDPMVEGYRSVCYDRPVLRFNWPEWRQAEKRQMAKRRTQQDPESGPGDVPSGLLTTT